MGVDDERANLVLRKLFVAPQSMSARAATPLIMQGKTTRGCAEVDEEAAVLQFGNSEMRRRRVVRRWFGRTSRLPVSTGRRQNPPRQPRSNWLLHRRHSSQPG